MTDNSLTVTESMQLLPVLALTLASGDGRRALLIKGEAANAQGLRQRHSPADVDVLVDPGGFVGSVGAFEDAGWTFSGNRRQLKHEDVLGVTLTHPLWPQTVDLHRRFLGFAADEYAVFEALWADRSSLSLAGHHVAVAGAVSSCLIQALHALRNPRWDSRNELGASAAWVLEGPPERAGALVALAQSTGASATARGLFDLCNVEIKNTEAGENAARIREFERRSARSDNLVVAYLMALRSTPVWTWPRRLVRFAMGNPASLHVWFDNSSEALTVAQMRRKRLGMALRQLPDALRTMWRTR